MPDLSEQDPLLPKSSSAPEIHGAQSHSLNNVDIVEVHVTLEEETPHRERSLNNVLAVVFGICLTLSLVLAALPDDFYKGLLPKPTPKTIGQRVSKILEDTPLIGLYSYTSYLLAGLTDSRWT